MLLCCCWSREEPLMTSWTALKLLHVGFHVGLDQTWLLLSAHLLMCHFRDGEHRFSLELCVGGGWGGRLACSYSSHVCVTSQPRLLSTRFLAPLSVYPLISWWWMIIALIASFQILLFAFYHRHSAHTHMNTHTCHAGLGLRGGKESWDLL